jgi:hypothetical protein
MEYAAKQSNMDAVQSVSAGIAKWLWDRLLILRNRVEDTDKTLHVYRENTYEGD